ncbi:MAG: ferredoxin [Deltaproteobacteria bacterium]|nr:MAG: ferredoxin [Deltaproteobacteria bacterium]HEX16394.1 4Fe-4S dicluster domain-containing protein [Deltaproteobacteria bacterium]
MIPVVDRRICTGCGKCLQVCPPRALELREGKATIDEEFCEECGICAAHCPEGAIAIPWPDFVPHNEQIS